MLTLGRYLSVATIVSAMALFIRFGAVAEDMTTPAQGWKDTSQAEQRQLAQGLMLGCKVGVVKAVDVLVERRRGFQMSVSRFNVVTKAMREKCLYEKPSVVIDAVTKLYQDPANNYVANEDAIDISILTMRGTQVESQLRQARRVGYEAFAAVQKEQRKD